MLRRVVLLLLCVVVCLLFVSPRSSAAQQSDSAPPAIPDLSGEWTATGYSDDKPVSEETIKIEQQNDSITATKVTGDRAIHAGEVTWKGTLKADKTRQGYSMQSAVQMQRSHSPDFKDRLFTTETLTIVSPNELTVAETTLRRNNKIKITLALFDQFIPKKNQTPMYGDVITYRVGGKIVHTGIVSVVKNGIVTEIESKWGAWGRYEHTPDDVLNYGASWDIYHTNRAGGNVLKRSLVGAYKTDKDTIIQQLPTTLIVWLGAKLGDTITLESIKKRMAIKPGLYERLHSVPVHDEPDWDYNCHGWTFASGNTWIDDAEIPVILLENGYYNVMSQRK